MRWLVVTSILFQLPFISRADNNLFPYINYSAKPCDNFYNFACGNFQTVHPIPPAYETWDEFKRLQINVDGRLKELLESGRSENDSKSFTKARKMYAACIDIENNENAKGGVFLIQKILSGWPTRYYIESTTSKITSTDWQNMANLVANYGVQFIFKLTIRTDLFNATRTAIYIESDDLALPTSLLKEPVRILDNDFSSKTDSTFIEYLRRIMTVLRDFNGSDIDDKELLNIAKSINEFMIGLNDAMALDYGEETTTTNIIPYFGPTTLADVQAWTDRVLHEFNNPINWETYLRNALRKSGVRVDSGTRVFITNRSLLRNLLIYTHKTEKRLLVDFVYSRLTTHLAPELSSKLYEIALNFYTIRGYVPPGFPRWKYCLHKVLDFPKIGLSFALAQKYREIYISEERVERAQEMVENLKKALEELINEADWMDDFTRNYAIYKLKNILILAGSPDHLRTRKEVDKYYKKLKIFKNDHFGNMNRLRSFNQRQNFAELGIPRNRNSWTQSPLIVNAYYNGINNRILFPISTMTEPFFSGNATSFLDYARIGSIMAHELTHAFDSQGRLLDAEGSMISWWSQLTAEIYSNKTKCFVDQYNKYIVKEFHSNVDGRYTLAENIADNVGLRAAFRAFKNEERKNLSLTSRRHYFSKDQEFYLAFASIWCHTGAMVFSDKHSPHRYRVLGPLRNMKNFHETWHCKRSRNHKTNRIAVRSGNVDKDICILW